MIKPCSSFAEIWRNPANTPFSETVPLVPAGTRVVLSSFVFVAGCTDSDSAAYWEGASYSALPRVEFWDAATDQRVFGSTAVLFRGAFPNNPTNVSATSTSVNIPGMGILFDGLILKALSPPPKDTVTETNFNLNVIYEF